MLVHIYRVIPIFQEAQVDHVAGALVNGGEGGSQRPRKEERMCTKLAGFLTGQELK